MLSGLAVLLAVPVLVLTLQVLLAFAGPVRRNTDTRERLRVSILVPAHNEEFGLGETLSTLKPQLRKGDRLLVVADNCSDNTAEVARTAGAEVTERFDSVLRGKGYALDHGLRFLAAAPTEVVIVVDADCLVGPDAIDILASQCLHSKRPVQALYLMHSPAGAGVRTKIAEFAWLVKNLVRPAGYARMQLPCQLMGTGMAFLWDDIRAVELASGHIVEDLKLGIDLCSEGKPPLFCVSARVSSMFPSSDEGLKSQRTRWEHGHLGVLLRDAPRLIHRAISRGNIALLALALDLVVPPLALLLLAVTALFLVSGLCFYLFGLAFPFGLASIEVVLMGLSVLLAWARYGRRVITFSQLAFAPLYALMKVPLYLRFLANRQVEWVRSKRDGT